MRVYFLESSALAKLFVMEDGSQAIIELVESLAQPQKLLSSLGFVEVHSAIRRRERAGEITPAHADQATTGLTDVVFVASDKVLLAAAQSEDFEVWNPEKGLPYPAR